ncbi:MAG: hypothetical protein IJB68_06780, partial [Ruminococcus sp.]|nr:hypothetical protein [Ruminococcus sp.]
MKKLLSAVTSVLMASSFVTSAFASSFNVSAAGGVSAVQPNVSMEEVIDRAANKYAVQNDFVVTGSKVNYVAGKDAVIDFTVQSGGHKGAMIGFEIADLPAGIKAEVDGFCYAFDDMPAWEVLGEQWASKCMDPSTQDPRAFNDGEVIVSLTLNVPSNIADGTYDIDLEYFHVVEQPSEVVGPIVEFDAKVVPGQLIVGNGGGSSSTPTNPPSQGGNVQNDFVVTGATVTYDSAKDTVMDFTVESNGHKGAMIGFVLADLPAGIKAEVDGFCYAFEDMPAWEALGEQWACKCMDPSSQDPRTFTDGEAIISLTLDVPANIADGTYTIDLEYFHVVEQPSEVVGPIVEFDAKVVPGKLIVGNGGGSSSTPTDPPSQGGNVQNDFVVTGATVTYDSAKDTVMDFTVESNGHK